MKQALSWLQNKRRRYQCQQKCYGVDAPECFHDKTVNVLVLGAEGVGKTSLIRTLIGEGMDNGKKPTVYDVYEKEFKEDLGTVRIEFTDMTGKISFPVMEKLAIKKSDVFVLVYSLDRTKTLNEVERLRKAIIQIKDKSPEEIPMIVVGNKMDLVDIRAEFDPMKESYLTHIHTSVRNQINLCALEMALIQECIFHLIIAEDPPSQNQGRSIIYCNCIS